MNHVFKEGASVHIYLAEGKDINGTVVYVAEEYVHLHEKHLTESNLLTFTLITLT